MSSDTHAPSTCCGTSPPMVALVDDEGAERRQALLARAMIDEVELAPRELVAVALGVLASRRDDAIEILRARQRIEQHAVDEAHDRGHRAEREGERRDRGEREGLLPQQAAERVAQVGSQLIEAKAQRRGRRLRAIVASHRPITPCLRVLCVADRRRPRSFRRRTRHGTRAAGSTAARDSARCLMTSSLAPGASRRGRRAPVFSSRAASASATSRPNAVSL